MVMIMASGQRGSARPKKRSVKTPEVLFLNNAAVINCSGRKKNKKLLGPRQTSFSYSASDIICSFNTIVCLLVKNVYLPLS